MAGSLLHLNTSQGEGWGLCVLEAAALGVPTVAYDVDGLRDAVRDGETGWLVRDGEQLADVVDRALKELGDPARRAAVASACRRWAARLDWDRSTARMAALIHASVQTGTARANRAGAWIVAGPDGDVLAEGPVLDQLIAGGRRRAQAGHAAGAADRSGPAAVTRKWIPNGRGACSPYCPMRRRPTVTRG